MASRSCSVFSAPPPPVSSDTMVDSRVSISPIGPESALANLEGEETREPTYGLAAKWVEKAHVNVLCFDSVAVIATRLAEVIRSHAADLLGRQEVQTIYDRVKKVLPTSIVPQLLSLGEVQLVLQNLLEDGFPLGKRVFHGRDRAVDERHGFFSCGERAVIAACRLLERFQIPRAVRDQNRADLREAVIIFRQRLQ